MTDIKSGCDPDFGFVNDLVFENKPLGWHLFVGLIGNYSRYSKVTQYIQDIHEQKRIREIKKNSKSLNRRRKFIRQSALMGTLNFDRKKKKFAIKKEGFGDCKSPTNYLAVKKISFADEPKSSIHNIYSNTKKASDNSLNGLLDAKT